MRGSVCRHMGSGLLFQRGVLVRAVIQVRLYGVHQFILKPSGTGLVWINLFRGKACPPSVLALLQPAWLLGSHGAFFPCHFFALFALSYLRLFQFA